MVQPRAHALWAVFVGSALAGCTDVNLCALDPNSPASCRPYVEPRLDNRIEVSGVACTREAASLVFPQKVLFVIDVSGSNQQNDPSGRRGQAVWNAIQEFAENRAVSFAIIRFTDFAEDLTGGFTRDMGLLQSVIPRLNEALSATHYLETLQLTHDVIDRDAELATAAERSRTTYTIHWLSDGQPMVASGCETPELVLAKTDRVMSLEAKYGLFNLFLNTTRLGTDNSPAGSNCPAPPGPYHYDDYLPPMAERGHGTFTQTNADELRFELSFTEVYRSFAIRDLMVINENRVVIDGELRPDSDGDGLEDDADPDALVCDANADGCNDRVDVALRPNDQALCANHCSQSANLLEGGALADRDGDGLPDCAEQILGSARDDIDADGDEIPDPIEIKFGTNPLDPNTRRIDTDRDGVVDSEEIRLGTNPLYGERDAELRYVYEPMSIELPDEAGVQCMRFRIANVQLVETQPAADRRRGENLICVYAMQTRADEPDGALLVTRACKPARYLKTEAYDLKEPANGFLEFTPEEFTVAFEPGSP